MSEISTSPHRIAGVRLACVAAGIRKNGRPDLTLVEICPGATAAAVFTRNVFCAAPVTLARRHLAAAMPRLLVINAGNANAGTGEQGLADALTVCQEAGARLNCAADAVLPFSTGVIGQRLPAEKLVSALSPAIAELRDDAWEAAAHGIMTTDTVPKLFSARVDTAHGPCHITGITKGAGMIKPDMATMLAFIATDAKIGQSDLQTLVSELADRSFNRITIDGDTSTNDACILIASAQGPTLSPASPDWPSFRAALEGVFCELARAIVRDGEADCLRAAYAVAASPLVKTALFASDPNWGLILAAVGRSGASGLVLTDIDIAIGGVRIVAGGEPVPGYDEADVARVMAGAEYTIEVRIGQAATHATVLTCDFSYDYVKINAEYRS